MNWYTLPDESGGEMEPRGNGHSRRIHGAFAHHRRRVASCVLPHSPKKAEIGMILAFF